MFQTLVERSESHPSTHLLLLSHPNPPLSGSLVPMETEADPFANPSPSTSFPSIHAPPLLSYSNPSLSSSLVPMGTEADPFANPSPSTSLKTDGRETPRMYVPFAQR